MQIQLKHALAMAALASCCAATQAANVTLTGWAYGSGGVVSGNLYGGWAGGFGGTLAAAGAFDANPFITYCVELSESFSFSASPMLNYQVVDGTSYFGATRAQHMAQLLSHVTNNPTLVDSAPESVAMQLAVWNVVYDDDYSIGSGSFRDSSVFAAHAQTLLTGASSVTAPLLSVFALQRSGSQDFLLSARLPQPQQQDHQLVPEPVSAALVGVALLGLASARRRWRA